MAVYKAEWGLVESELNHKSTFPAVAKQVFHYQVFSHIIGNIVTVLTLDKYREEKFSFADEFNHFVVFA